MASDDQFDYQRYTATRPEWIQQRATDPRRFVAITDRKDTTNLPAAVIKGIELGKYITNWRDVGVCKDPLDMVIYQSMVWDIRPASIIEIGALQGGTALWLADLVKVLGIKCQIYSFDKDLSLLSPAARDRTDITFLEGDCFQIEKTFTTEMMEKLPHPWFVMEDAHVNLQAVFEHFYSFMKTGDYLVVEDGQPSLQQKVDYRDEGADNPDWGDFILREIREFMERHPEELKIDTFYNDRFGYNVTWNVNGFIRRM